VNTSCEYHTSISYQSSAVITKMNVWMKTVVDPGYTTLLQTNAFSSW